MPALETEEGPIFESNAILRYIARFNNAAGLYG
jgi:glutathione S-transferase